MAVLLISEQYIKDNSLIEGNVEAKLLTPMIILSQDKYILPLLGTTLYNDILSQVVANTVSSDYQSLLNDYIQKALLWYVQAEAVLPLSYKFTNKNVMQKNSDNSVPATMSDLLKLKDQFLNDAEYYANRCRLHLLANPDTFPKYRQITGNSIETVRPETTPYQTGFALTPTYPPNERIPFHILYDGPNGWIPEGYDPDTDYRYNG